MKRVLLSLVLLAVAAPARADEPCKVIVLPVEARGLPASLATLAQETLRREATRGGCALIEGKVVADMTRMLRLPARPSAPDMARLASALLADWVLHAALAAGRRVSVEVSGYTNQGVKVARGATVPADLMLPSLARLVGEVVGTVRPRPASQPVVSAPPAVNASPATQVAVSASPATQPAPSPPPVVSPVPPTIPAVVSPPVAQPDPAVPPPPVALPAPDQPPAGVAKRGAATDLRLWVAAGLRSYYVSDWDRGGPLAEVELGAATPNTRRALLYRSYFGDRTSHYLGGRFEGGPRWGPVRLSFGADLGVLFVPDTADALDLLVLNLHLAGVTLHWGPWAMHLDALAFDVYVIPADTSIGRDVKAMRGFSTGLTIGFVLPGQSPARAPRAR